MTETLTDTTAPPAGPKRSTGIRLLRGFGWGCIVAGVLILGFVVQQLFVTSWLAERNQGRLYDHAVQYFADTVESVEEVEFLPPPRPERPESPPQPATLLVEPAPPVHEAFAVIRIPALASLQDGWTVVEGVERSDLRNGAGHMVHTALPGQPGNAVISGHRTTYGAPFHDLDQLRPGDLIEVETAVGLHEYRVVEWIIVEPHDLWVTEPREGAWLTLTTCHPKFSSRQRLVVFAELSGGPNAAAILGP